MAKDVETSRLTLHMIKLFCKFPNMLEQILNARADIIPAILQTFRDKDLPVLSKREALQVVPFLVKDTASIDAFVKVRIEDYLIEFLEGSKDIDRITSQVLKTIILMHLSTTILNIGNEVGTVFVDKGGLTLLSQLLVDKLAESNMNWKVFERLISAIFVLCFKEKNVDALK